MCLSRSAASASIAGMQCNCLHNPFGLKHGLCPGMADSSVNIGNMRRGKLKQRPLHSTGHHLKVVLLHDCSSELAQVLLGHLTGAQHLVLLVNSEL